MKENIKTILREYTEEKLLEEGFKEWALTGLITLASLSGISQKKGNISSEDLKKAEMVQQRLESGDKDLLKLFSQADIDLNKQNLEKLKGVDVKVSKPFKTKKIKDVETRLKQGYSLTKANVKTDTINIIKAGENVAVDTLLMSKYGDMFKTGGFDLHSEVINELGETINNIKSKGGKINKVYIESSTDKEPIKMGNQKLAELRANTISNVLKELGVESQIDIKTKPEQGPDVYTQTMSPQQREEARQQTAEFRYNKIIFDVSFSRETPYEISINKIIQKLEFELVKGTESSHKTKSTTGGTHHGGVKKLVFKCKKWITDKMVKAKSCPRVGS